MTMRRGGAGLTKLIATTKAAMARTNAGPKTNRWSRVRHWRQSRAFSIAARRSARRRALEEVADLREERDLGRGRRGGGGSCPTKKEDRLHEEERGNRHPEKGDDGVDEEPHREHHRSRLPRGLDGGVDLALGIPEHPEDAAEVRSPQQRRDQRHEEVVDQGLHHRAERGADDDADRHVDHVALHGELAEFLQHDGLPARKLVALLYPGLTPRDHSDRL